MRRQNALLNIAKRQQDGSGPHSAALFFATPALFFGLFPPFWPAGKTQT